MPKNRRRKIRGAYIIAINDVPVFDKASVTAEFRKLHQQIKQGKITDFTIDITPLPTNSRKNLWKECIEHNIFIPDPHNDNSNASLNIEMLKSIVLVRTDKILNNKDISNKEITIMVNAL